MEDNIYENIMFILKNLQVNGLEIEELDENSSMTSNVKDSKGRIKELFSNKDLELFRTIDDPMQWQKQQRDEW